MVNNTDNTNYNIGNEWVKNMEEVLRKNETPTKEINPTHISEQQRKAVYV